MIGATINVIMMEVQVGGNAGPWYLDIQMSTIEQWALTFGTYFLLQYQFIPTSLFVTLPVIQQTTRLLMMGDKDMQAEGGDDPNVRTVGLMDELGQVSHIFSDKTGTLTSNLMVMRRMYIDGVNYGCGDTAISRSLRGENANPPARNEKPLPEWAGCNTHAKDTGHGTKGR